MKQPYILYGVQGSSKGAISRARLMSTELHRLNVGVDFVFSGLTEKTRADVQDFANVHYRTGFNGVVSDGRVSKSKTLLNNHPVRYLKEVSTLRTDRYDLIISDGEPTVSWAARLRGTPSVAIGHRFALDTPAPQPRGEQLSKWLQRSVAPAEHSIGLHWHPYGRETLPPIVNQRLSPNHIAQSFTLVYLPYDNLAETVAKLEQLRREHFVVYSSQVSVETQRRNVSIYPPSQSGFEHHLQRCNRLVCNSSFQLMSEAMYLGIPSLVKPLRGHFEQEANAMALKEFEQVSVARNIGVLTLDRFIYAKPKHKRFVYPDVASALSRYCVSLIEDTDISEDCNVNLSELASKLWASTHHNDTSSKALSPGLLSVVA